MNLLKKNDKKLFEISLESIFQKKAFLEVQTRPHIKIA